METPSGPTLTRVLDPGQRPALELSGPGGVARVSPLGAHVQSWRVPGRGELLFTSAAASYAPGVATRGGIPVVFPWFGAHATRSELPAHGFARTAEWAIADVGPGPSVLLRLEEDDATRAVWPHAFRAELEVSVADGLRLALTVVNTGAAPFRYEEALHTYFTVGDVRQATVHGLEGVPFTEFARAPQSAPRADAPIAFEAETDRVFQGVPAELELRCPAAGHDFLLRTEGSRSTVVWNPWAAKAAAMSQLDDDEWPAFACVESANCKDGARTLGPGERATLALTLRVRAGQEA